MSTTDQKVEDIILKKIMNRSRNLKIRLEKIKLCESQIKHEPKISLNKDQLESIKKKEEIIIILNEVEKIGQSINECINENNKIQLSKK